MSECPICGNDFMVHDMFDGKQYFVVFSCGHSATLDYDPYENEAEEE